MRAAALLLLLRRRRLELTCGRSFKWRLARGRASMYAFFEDSVKRQPDDAMYVYERQTTTWKQAEQSECSSSRRGDVPGTRAYHTLRQGGPAHALRGSPVAPTTYT